MGTLYVPALSIENNLFNLTRTKLRQISTGLGTIPSAKNNIWIHTGCSSCLNLPDNSVDYIFIDPPFGKNINYSELNFMWEGWLKVFTASKSEAIMNKTQKKGLPEYQHLIERCFGEFHRVLKPGRWMTIEFHNSQNSIWNAIAEAIQKSGFVMADVRVLDKKQSSFKQIVSAGAVNKDLVISAYKPDRLFVESFLTKAGTEEGLWEFLRTHLKQLPVFVSKDGEVEVITERQNYLLFDRMVAFHVQRGVTIPLSAAEFYAGLDRRFSERDGMYFLSEQVAEYDKKRMTAKGLGQLELFVQDEATAIQWLKQQLLSKPQTFQELHPQFMREISGWQKFEKSLELKEMLEQNFFCYDGKGDVPGPIHSYLSTNFKEFRNLGKSDSTLQAKAKSRWYVPDPNRVGDLEKLREKALLKEFLEYLPEGYKPTTKHDIADYIPGFEPNAQPVPRGKRMKIIRLEAVRAGFKHCWQNRDYRTIIAVAQRIPDNILQEDPKLLMWYDQAVTRTED